MAYDPNRENAEFLDLVNCVRRNLPHLRVSTAAISTANATDDTTAIALCNAERTALVAHFAEAYSAGTGGHTAADTANAALLPAVATAINDVFTAEAALRACYQAHTEFTGHVHADAVGKVVLPSSAEDGSKAALYARLNLLKTAINAHLARTATSAAAA